MLNLMSIVIESALFSVIMITLWMSAERLVPKLSAAIKEFIKRRRRTKYTNGHNKRRRKSSPTIVGPSVPHFWRS
ncbi:MAG: hypothetical protein RMJ14_05010 [Nitrososphaerota archaeon]|nr:hypothetical protein [Aigarchaeota archaeon]MDW8076979.1 hypothetical protein [Nitrososphaerota archaeon]